MPRKLLNDVDGFTVDEYAGTFTGTFEVTGADARYLAYDDEVLIVVRARVKPPRLKETRGGEIVRVNVLGVKEAGVVRSEQLKQHLCESLGLETPAPQLPFDSSAVPGPAEEIEDLVVELRNDEGGSSDEKRVETDVEIFSAHSEESHPGLDRGPGRVEKRLVSSTRDARLAAFLSES